MYHLRILSYEPILKTVKKVRRNTDIEGNQRHLTYTDLVHSYKDDECLNTIILTEDEEFARYIANREYLRIRKEKPLHSIDISLMWYRQYGYNEIIDEKVIHFKRLPG